MTIALQVLGAIMAVFYMMWGCFAARLVLLGSLALLRNLPPAFLADRPYFLFGNGVAIKVKKVSVGVPSRKNYAREFSQTSCNQQAFKRLTGMFFQTSLPSTLQEAGIMQ